MTPCDILCRRTRLAFLNSTAAHLSVQKVVAIMARELNWSEERQAREIQEAHEVLGKDFLGPIPSKNAGSFRAASVADVKHAFDKCDEGWLRNQKATGRVKPEMIQNIAAELGFPDLFSSESSDQQNSGNIQQLKKAIEELDVHNEGYVTFAAVLSWWNNHPDVQEQKRILFPKASSYKVKKEKKRLFAKINSLGLNKHKVVAEEHHDS